MIGAPQLAQFFLSGASSTDDLGWLLGAAPETLDAAEPLTDEPLFPFSAIISLDDLAWLDPSAFADDAFLERTLDLADDPSPPVAILVPPHRPAIPKFVPFNESAPDRRDRAHQQVVSGIFNSLMRQGVLTQAANSEWMIGDPSAAPTVLAATVSDLVTQVGALTTSVAQLSNQVLALTASATAAAVAASLAQINTTIPTLLGRPAYSPPAVASYSWVNQGLATASDADYGIYLEAPASGSDNLRMLVKSLPATPFTITTRIIPNLTPNAVLLVGIGFRESSSGRIFTHGVACTGTSDWYAPICTKWTSPTVYLSDPAFVQSAYKGGLPPDLWLRLRGDGTSIFFDWSVDGYVFENLYSEAKNAFFVTAPNQAIIVADSNNASNSAGVRVLSWIQS